jgi:hypothetical protein
MSRSSLSINEENMIYNIKREALLPFFVLAACQNWSYKQTIIYLLVHKVYPIRYNCSFGISTG